MSLPVDLFFPKVSWVFLWRTKKPYLAIWPVYQSYEITSGSQLTKNRRTFNLLYADVHRIIFSAIIWCNGDFSFFRRCSLMLLLQIRSNDATAINVYDTIFLNYNRICLRFLNKSKRDLISSVSATPTILIEFAVCSWHFAIIMWCKTKVGRAVDP